MTVGEKILGGLIGAAAGDAMGAATEIRTKEETEALFGGYVREFYQPPMDCYARGREAGQVTDDFSIPYLTLQEILKDGSVNDEAIKRALFAWSDIPAYYTRFAGPTTRAKIEAMKGNVSETSGFVAIHDNMKATNGAAMKAAPIAMLAKGDTEKAFEYVMQVCRMTHDNNVALAGAGAIAYAVSEAFQKNATIDSIAEAAVAGAEKGNEYGIKYCRTVAGASMVRRIKLAIKLAKEAETLEQAIIDIRDIIGSGLMAAEAVPAAIGLCVAAKGDACEGIYAGVNVGDDTDTIATMIGGVLGVLNGASAFPADYMEILDKQNDFDLAGTAKRMEIF